jgi:hypothetical protein
MHRVHTPYTSRYEHAFFQQPIFEQGEASTSADPGTSGTQWVSTGWRTSGLPVLGVQIGRATFSFTPGDKADLSEWEHAQV